MENVLTSAAPFSIRHARALVWTGRVLTGLIVAFMTVDAVAKLMVLAPVVEATRQLGLSVTVIRPLGLLLAMVTLLHALPRTQSLGALLLTAYLGGATATLVRAGTPFWFPVVMGATLWIAYYLRSPNLRAFVRSSTRW